MKKTSQIVLFLVLILLGCNKKTSLDKATVSAEDSLKTYLSLANDINLPYELKQKYAKKAFSIIIDENNDSINRANLFKVANRYYNMKDLESYRDISKLILERSISAKDSVSIGKAYTYLGDFYGAQSIPDSAFLNFLKLKKFISGLMINTIWRRLI
ncbi:hypothetical protein ACQ9BO_01375 [Flavobacterium sp. P21]|uniref:hypothetical protein n=1 Tax=Flavobacterium sp. P21 TaxID=3423948 RepID=UPI003D679D92